LLGKTSSIPLAITAPFHRRTVPGQLPHGGDEMSLFQAYGGSAAEKFPTAPRPKGRRHVSWLAILAIVAMAALVLAMPGLVQLPATEQAIAASDGGEYDRWVEQPSIQAVFLREDGEEARAREAKREADFLAKHRPVNGAQALKEGLITAEASHPTPNLFSGGCRVVVKGGDKYVLTVRHPDSFVLILDVSGVVAEQVRQDTLTVFTVANGEPGELSLAISGLRIYRKL